MIDIEKLMADLEMAKAGINNLLVAVRGGGDLRPAMAEAQALIDELNKPAEQIAAEEEKAAE